MAICTACFGRPFFLAIITAYVFACKTENIMGFSAELFQIDSYGSPFYDPSLSKTDIILRAIAHSVNRSKLITTNTQTFEIPDHRSYYMMKIRVGTPPVEMLALADINTALTWIPCESCSMCKHHSIPIFNPSDSSSFTKITCGPANPCPSESSSECGGDGFCHYYAPYSDGSHSMGTLSTDIMQISLAEIPRYIFGCGSKTVVMNHNLPVPAVIGLGVGQQSLLTQLGSQGADRFLYCLLPLGTRGKVSHIYFGRRAKVHKTGSIKIPMITKHRSHSYHVTLEAFTIGNTRIEFTGASGTVEEGNTVMDSSTPMTGLPLIFYSKIVKALISQASMPPVESPQTDIGLCFKRDSIDGPLRLPSIVANFKGGDIPLKHSNVFLRIDDMECLAFFVNGRASYGTLAQQDFVIAYDRRKRTISFKPYNCVNFG